MNSVEFLECFEVSHDHFLQMRKFLPNMDRIWRWRHRSWPEVEKWTAQHKFPTDYDAKRIRAISLTSFQKKIQNCPPLKKISTLTFQIFWIFYFQNCGLKSGQSLMIYFIQYKRIHSFLIKSVYVFIGQYATVFWGDPELYSLYKIYIKAG